MDSYRCYHCRYTADSPKDILTHTVHTHFSSETPFSLRQKHYDENQGLFGYVSFHFKTITLGYIKQALENCDKIDIDLNSLRISFKRACPSDPEMKNVCQSTQTDETDSYKLFLLVIEKMRDIGRYNDFCGLLSAIAKGNIIRCWPVLFVGFYLPDA